MAKKGQVASYLAGREVPQRKTPVDFATSQKEIIQETRQEAEAKATDISHVPHILLELLDDNPYQPRKWMDEGKLQELTGRMEANGITSVIVARRHPQHPERYQLAYGHRRREAARRAGYTAYPTLIKEISDEDMLYWAAEENRFREGLTPIEEGYMFNAMIDTGNTQEGVAFFYKVQRSYVRDRIALVDTYPDVQALTNDRHDTVRVAARYLSKIDDETIRSKVIAALREEDITGNQVPAYIETLQQARSQLRDSSREPVSVSEAGRETQKEVVSNVEEVQLPAGDGNSPFSLESMATEYPDQKEEEEHTQIPSRKTPLQGAKSESAILLEQSRLRTMEKQLTQYEGRLYRRIEQAEDIPVVERELLEQLHEHLGLLLEKIDK